MKRALGDPVFRAIVGGCALGFSIGWPITNIGAIADPLADAYGVSLATVGLFTTALFGVHAILQIPAGRAVDRFGPKRLGMFSIAVTIAMHALAMIAADPALAIATRALLGVGLAAGFISGLEYVRTQGGSPFAQGLYGGIGLGAGGAALAVVPALEGAAGWRTPFATGLAVAVVCGVLLWLGPPDVPREARRLPFAGAVRGVLTDRRIYRLAVMYMASLGLSVVLGNWVVSLLTRAGGYGTSTAGAIGSLILVCGVVSRPFGGYLARRFPDRMRLVLLGSFAAAAVGTGLLTLAGPVWLSVLATLMFGFAAGIPFAPSFIAATRIRPEAPAVAMATVNMSANLVIVAGTPLLGLSFMLPGDGRIGFAAASGLWLIALGTTMFVRELDSPRAPALASGH